MWGCNKRQKGWIVLMVKSSKGTKLLFKLECVYAIPNGYHTFVSRNKGRDELIQTLLGKKILLKILSKLKLINLNNCNSFLNWLWVFSFWKQKEANSGVIQVLYFSLLEWCLSKLLETAELFDFYNAHVLKSRSICLFEIVLLGQDSINFTDLLFF